MQVPSALNAQSGRIKDRSQEVNPARGGLRRGNNSEKGKWGKRVSESESLGVEKRHSPFPLLPVECMNRRLKEGLRVLVSAGEESFLRRIYNDRYSSCQRARLAHSVP
jgi:hypothetical protein